MMRRYDLGDGIVEIKHSDGSDRSTCIDCKLFWLFLNAYFRLKGRYR